VTGSPDGGSSGPDMQRAEELLDQMLSVAGAYASQASLWIMKTVARGREELEDIWAEAQSLSHGDES
jgi:hypothetical protein